MTSDLWTSMHSLNSILCLIGNQCNSRRAEDTWSRGRRSMTKNRFGVYEVAVSRLCG